MCIPTTYDVSLSTVFQLSSFVSAWLPNYGPRVKTAAVAVVRRTVAAGTNETHAPRYGPRCVFGTRQVQRAERTRTDGRLSTVYLTRSGLGGDEEPLCCRVLCRDGVITRLRHWGGARGSGERPVPAELLLCRSRSAVLRCATFWGYKTSSGEKARRVRRAQCMRPVHAFTF